jgi:hypothetical protein
MHPNVNRFLRQQENRRRLLMDWFDDIIQSSRQEGISEGYTILNASD